jgi:acetolactate synthase-1/2/3 large subunit
MAKAGSGTAVARTGARILVDQLAIHGVDLAFCVPGESYLAVIDALYESRNDMRLIVCRHEAGAANMAEAYGKLTGKPGICFVTRGPGATHASIGLHTAFQDSTPMILFIGQVARGQMEREAFQEIDYRRAFGQVAKWVAQIDDAARIPELVARAFATAVNGRPGPVVLALPEDMLDDVATVLDTAAYKRAPAAPTPDQLCELAGLLADAKRPLVIAGGGGWNAQASADLKHFAENHQIPVAVSFRCQDLFDNRHPLYAGDLGLGSNALLAKRVDEADLLLVLGARLGEATTNGYTIVKPPVPHQTLIHVHSSAEELGRVYQPDLPINAASGAMAGALAALPKPVSIPWSDWARSVRADLETHRKPIVRGTAVDMAGIIEHLNSVLPDDAILTNGAGNYTTWVHRFYQYRQFRTQLAPTSGAMGYGVPAAISAKLTHPERTVIGFAGDGCFLMCAQEMATAAQYGVGVILIVVNNGSYGTIRMHQEKHYPERVYGTDLSNPDFVAMAKSFHLHAELVERTDQFAGAFERAQKAGGPALIEIRLDIETLTPRATLSQIRQQALAAKK